MALQINLHIECLRLPVVKCTPVAPTQGACNNPCHSRSPEASSHTESQGEAGAPDLGLKNGTGFVQTSRNHMKLAMSKRPGASRFNSGRQKERTFSQAAIMTSSYASISCYGHGARRPRCGSRINACAANLFSFINGPGLYEHPFRARAAPHLHQPSQRRL